MARPVLEVADVFRSHGPAWRRANAGHVSLGQLKAMSAIESCRTAALGGHVVRCEDCSHTQIAYNSCRNRHCPKCQGSQALAWMEERKAELLGVPYFHVVFTLPVRIAAIAYQNKAVIYDLLFKASSQTMLTIAADPKRLGVKIGFTSVLHTWGSAMTHHPHVHMIVPGGGISLDSTRWIGCRPKYLLPVKVLSRLFRPLMLEMLVVAHDAGRLQFFGDHAHLADKAAFKAYLAPLHRTKWFVYCKRPFAGPEQVLAYLSRYTHRVAISNSRLSLSKPHRRDREGQAWVARFRDELQKVGWTEGSKIRINYGWAGGDAESRKQIAKRLVEQQPDLIVTQNTPTTQAVIQHTHTIPIVFANVGDPVRSGFVASFPRPGGNVTGFVNGESGLGGKWLALLRETVPHITRIAFLFNPTSSRPDFAEYFKAARSYAVQAASVPVRDISELESASPALAREPDGGLIIVPDTFFNVHATEVISLAARYRLPAAYPYRFFAERGGLFSYGTEPLSNFQRLAVYVDRILKGEKPANLPVQAPTKYELVINLKTAKTLGLTIPETLLATADQVIE